MGGEGSDIEMDMGLRETMSAGNCLGKWFPKSSLVTCSDINKMCTLRLCFVGQKLMGRFRLSDCIGNRHGQL
jgi:hypothetical protein